MTDRDPDSSRNLLEGKQNNLHRVNNCAMKSEKYLEDYERLRSKLAQVTCYLYGLAAVVVAGMLILIVIVAVLYGKLSYDVAHHSHQPKVGEQIAKILERGKLCLPCNELRLGPSPEEENMLNKFTREEHDNVEKCCVETPSQLLELLELFIERTYREEMAKGNIKVPSSRSMGSATDVDRPAAHLMGDVQRMDQTQVPGKQFPISSWIYSTDLAFSDHVSYRHGRIVVPSDGLFYVYSQVSFLEVFNIHSDGSSSSYSTESPSLSHYLYRYNIIYPHGGEETLIQNSITKCWGQNKAFGEYTSYLGAVFHLRQGDEVFVKVSNITMVSRDPKSNYFGLFKL
ncbi:tumor necrosis factor ligand superfamily member 10-like [Haliotis rubra]|uniref:tumor necrosis factor ligand superfamily member 10-like n=1 Tax=Haliotis rubra TaxID=36100 RepID=UPI001EE4F583|nr:tumor necrosis factor ligand superfamily member 10-like [Haliotis rubra]